MDRSPKFSMASGAVSPNATNEHTNQSLLEISFARRRSRQNDKDGAEPTDLFYFFPRCAVVPGIERFGRLRAYI